MMRINNKMGRIRMAIDHVNRRINNVQWCGSNSVFLGQLNHLKRKLLVLEAIYQDVDWRTP